LDRSTPGLDPSGASARVVPIVAPLAPRPEVFRRAIFGLVVQVGDGQNDADNRGSHLSGVI
jgi:hypothetical protein